MTLAEIKLWKLLRRKNIQGMKFRRQHPLSRFITDFYCHQAKLVIELDGGYHDDQDQAESDLGRHQALEDMGLLVIRFRNEEIEMDVEGVVERIRKVLRERGLTPFPKSDPIPPDPLPQVRVRPQPPNPLPQTGKGE